MANVLVNGGSRGIGRGICEAFIKNGDNVFFTCKDEKMLNYSMKLLQKYTVQNHIYGCVCDSRNPKQVKDAVNSANDLMGGVDILVNNAGIRKYGTIEEINIDDWIDAVETNINGYFYFVKFVLPYLLISQNAWIFNVGSTAGIYAFSGGISYNTTKAATHGFSSSLELDVRERGVRVCNVIPGNVFNKDTECKCEDQWMLKPVDIGNTMVAQTKLEKNCLVSSLVIKPTNSPHHPENGIAALKYV